MNIEVKGKVHKVLNETVGKNNTQKKTVVVNINSEYNPYVPVEFIGKSYDKANCNEGDEVTVSVNLGGREWNGRYFPNINGWKVEVHNHSSSPSSQPESNGLPRGTEFEPTSDEEDDLPF